MSYLETVKNFSHCPLKKRPFQNVIENDVSEPQPQDLRVKRRREDDDVTPQETLMHTSQPQTTDQRFYPVGTHSLHDDYDYLRSISRPSDESQIPPLADFYLQLFQQSTSQAQHIALWPLNPINMCWKPSDSLLTPCSAPAPTLPPSESLHMSSPRSISSEDSGMGSEFVSEDEADSHKDDWKASHKHTCKSCSKSYSTSSGLRKHNELHCAILGPRTFSCKHCAKAYTSIGALKMHIRTHTLPCKCDVCGKAFSRPWLLQGHIRTHTGEKPFECQQCHRSFADRSNLRAHQQTHERVKKYACHSCKKTFSRMSLLNKHTESACLGLISMDAK